MAMDDRNVSAKTGYSHSMMFIKTILLQLQLTFIVKDVATVTYRKGSILMKRTRSIFEMNSLDSTWGSYFQGADGLSHKSFCQSFFGYE